MAFGDGVSLPVACLWLLPCCIIGPPYLLTASFSIVAHYKARLGEQKKRLEILIVTFRTYTVFPHQVEICIIMYVSLSLSDWYLSDFDDLL